MKPQTVATLDALRRHGDAGLTGLDALDEVGTFRLAARIAELKHEGYAVETEMVRTATGKRIARYRLKEAA